MILSLKKFQILPPKDKVVKKYKSCTLEIFTDNDDMSSELNSFVFLSKKIHGDVTSELLLGL